MADPILIQKQIKDNSEDLHNFVRDLKLWEEEMKRKDRQLSNDPSAEILPPVRRPRAENETPNKKQDISENKPQRIRSSDYKAWEKFDVDKACEEVDSELKLEEEEHKDNAEQEEKYLKEKALYEKEMGNQYVKASKWDSAIEAYTKAITAYSKDPIFFANRALCYLKKKKFEEVELDCTESLKLDTTYVKAYMRRAAAREALGRLEDARLDLRQVLRLEPNNVQAQRDLERVNKTATDVKEVKSKDACSSGITRNKTQQNHITGQKYNKANINKKATELGSKTVKFNEPSPEPSWKSCNHTVEPISKPPHLRSKKSLKRIEIQDIDSSVPEYNTGKEVLKPKPGTSVEQNAIDTKEKALTDSVPSLNHEEKIVAISSGLKPRSILTISTPVTSVPLPPKTSVQFHTAWRAIKHDNKLCYQFLKQIPGEELPDIFKESLESRMFSSIVEVLVSEFVTSGDPVLSYLRGLSSVRRFSTIALFMSATDKSNIRKLFHHCMSRGDCSSDDISDLSRLYEI